LLRATLASLLGAGVTIGVQTAAAGLGPLVSGVIGLGAGGLVVFPVIFPEIKLLFRL
jgi:hypothetical protein